jgi:hypothetical protein
MLRLLSDADSPPSAAYPVPWRIERICEAHPLVLNDSATVADFVRVFITSGRATVETVHWGQMLPGESAELCLCACDADDVIATIAWFRPDDGTEYVWRFAP